MSKTLDEALRRAGKIHNGYAGRLPDDAVGADVARRIVASLTRDGFVLVPREATPEMEEAGWIDKEDVCPCDIYTAMLAAAPKVGGSDD